MDAFDAFDARLSQSSQNKSEKMHIPSGLGIATGENTEARSSSQASTSGASTMKRRASGLEEDPDNPFDASVNPGRRGPVGFSSTSTLPMAGFGSASMLPKSGFASAAAFSKPGFSSASALASRSDEYDLTSSPEPPAVEPDYDAWFKPAPIEPPSLFTTAKFSSAALLPPEDVIPSIGFLKASHKGVLAPSSAALDKAQKKMNEIWSESAENNDTSLPMSATFKSASTISSHLSPKRPALRAMVNSLNSPSTPSPAGTSHLHAGAVFSPLEDKINRLARPKPFKSPLIKFNPPSSATSTYTNSPLNPTRLAGLSAFTTASQLSNTSRPPISTPRRENPMAGSSSFTTPLRPTGITPRTGRTAPPFITPFKSGMEPGQPARKKLEETLKANIRQLHTPTLYASPGAITGVKSRSAVRKEEGSSKFFDLG